MERGVAILKVKGNSVRNQTLNNTRRYQYLGTRSLHCNDLKHESYRRDHGALRGEVANRKWSEKQVAPATEADRPPFDRHYWGEFG